jgi:hypothetical protein
MGTLSSKPTYTAFSILNTLLQEALNEGAGRVNRDFGLNGIWTVGLFDSVEAGRASYCILEVTRDSSKEPKGNFKNTFAETKRSRVHMKAGNKLRACDSDLLNPSPVTHRTFRN